MQGGLKLDQHPTQFLDEAEARREAVGRLVAMRAAQAIRESVAAGGTLDSAASLVVRDEQGNTLFEGRLA